MAVRPPRSAGILLYRRADRAAAVEILIGHMGGPYWSKRDDGAWSIPKGLVDAADVDDLAAARREFLEETGHAPPAAGMVDLGVFAQSASKEIRIWAGPGDLDASSCRSNTFEMEWPPRSGRMEQFPEMDRFEWCSISEASRRLIAGQRQVLDALDRVTCTDIG